MAITMYVIRFFVNPMTIHKSAIKGIETNIPPILYEIEGIAINI